MLPSLAQSVLAFFGLFCFVETGSYTCMLDINSHIQIIRLKKNLKKRHTLGAGFCKWADKEEAPPGSKVEPDQEPIPSPQDAGGRISTCDSSMVHIIAPDSGSTEPGPEPSPRLSRTEEVSPLSVTSRLLRLPAWHPRLPVAVWLLWCCVCWSRSSL